MKLNVATSSAGPVTTTCLINNFNYASYVGEAIDSALRQTVPFNEIIVVDDGSTDGSFELLQTRYGRQPLVQIIGKSNAGQLSCFNEGFARATGDIVFFLDADDIYDPQYVEEALRVYNCHPSCDFLACGRQMFGQEDGISLRYSMDRDFGYSVLNTAHRREWIGAATSCLSIRRNILEEILPLPFVRDWRTRADDCLVFGASLAGAQKRYLSKALVRYRVHEQNHFHSRTSNRSTTYRRRMAINRLFEHFERKLCFNMQRLAADHHREFCTIDSPTLGQLLTYFGIGLNAQMSPIRRIGCIGTMLRHFLHMKWRSNLAGVEEQSPLTDEIMTLPFPTPLSTETTSDSQSEHAARLFKRAA